MHTDPRPSLSVEDLLGVIIGRGPNGPADMRPEDYGACSFAELGIDSFGLLEVVVRLEKRFGLTIPPSEITPENVRSVRHFAEHILQLNRNKLGTPS